MAIQDVQNVSGHLSISNAGSVTIAASGAGNALFVGVVYNTSSTSNITINVTDNKGNPYVLAINDYSSILQWGMSIFFCAAPTAGVTTVNVSGSGAGFTAVGGFFVSEFSGLTVTGVDGTAGIFFPSGTANPSTSFSTTHSGDLILGYAVSNNFIGPGSGFTGATFTPGIDIGMEWLQQTSAGSITVGWTSSNDSNFKGTVAAGFFGTASAAAVAHLLGCCGCGG